MRIKQGDTYSIPFQIQINKDSNTFLTLTDVEKIEFVFGVALGQKSENVIVKKTLDDGITYQNGSFTLNLTQEDTFDVLNRMEYQIRVKLNGEQVKSSSPAVVLVTPSISKEVL